MSFKENSPVAAREGFPSALANSSTGASSLKGFWELCSSLLAVFSCFYFAKYSGAQLSVKRSLDYCLDWAPHRIPVMFRQGIFDQCESLNLLLRFDLVLSRSNNVASIKKKKEPVMAWHDPKPRVRVQTFNDARAHVQLHEPRFPQKSTHLAVHRPKSINENFIFCFRG